MKTDAVTQLDLSALLAFFGAFGRLAGAAESAAKDIGRIADTLDAAYKAAYPPTHEDAPADGGLPPDLTASISAGSAYAFRGNAAVTIHTRQYMLGEFAGTASPSLPLSPSASQVIPPVAGGPDSDDTGQRFLHWLSEGLRTGSHKMNTTDAFLHTVKEGVLLVGPRVFKAYSPNNWEYVQKRFTKLGLHKPAPNNSNIWQYEVRGQKKSGVMRGFLLTNPLETLGVAYLPAPNKSVILFSIPSQQAADNATYETQNTH
jgi:hypothetical protein